jgi:hypothetical protein
MRRLRFRGLSNPSKEVEGRNHRVRIGITIYILMPVAFPLGCGIIFLYFNMLNLL